MTLLRQLIFAITALVMLLLAGNLVVSVYNARTYFYKQMQVHAQDTATSLGFSMSQAAQNKDVALMGSMVDVIFDRGYYQAVRYLNLEGEALVERNFNGDESDVPRWFVDAIEIPTPNGEAEVINGWFRLGKVQVVARTGLAYADLWRVFTEQLWLFAFTAVLAYGLAGLALHFLLRPLRKVERQADAICRREFSLQDELPYTPELRRVVQAMNRMVGKIQDMFGEQLDLTESLHRASHLDAVTGLSNRRDFDARLDAFIRSELGGGEGALLLLQLSQLEKFNGQFGREAGDQLLTRIADCLRPVTGMWPGAIISRRSGADFCVFVPSIDRLRTEQFCEQLNDTLQVIEWPWGPLPLHIGVAHEPSVTLDSKLLAMADQALREAQHGNGFGWRLMHIEAESARPAGEWRQLLQGVLEREELAFHYQPVYNASKKLLHREVFVRMEIDGKLQSAGVFLPQLERFQLMDRLDRTVLENIARLPLQKSVSYCVNISPGSVAQAQFRDWLAGFFAKNPAFAKRLILEVSESVVASAEPALRQLTMMANSVGARVSLDHFGTVGRAFNYLQSLPLYSLKVDRSFISNMSSRQDNQFFVKSLAQIAHSCDMILLAEGVETAAEWQQVADLGLDGGQGYYLGRPAADKVE